MPTVRALVARGSCSSIVTCATAWLQTYEAALKRGADKRIALHEAASSWDHAAAEYRGRETSFEQADQPDEPL